ncbi:lysophospholipid acyltransferase family protein [Propionicicella superfundia]|uniref:lysophospholipid acyltransferase family protein n=1 Tax=Propionicicella superfundia TaxID=348582 RepID=UPI00042A8027|nr:lysophospholipid acyltransferase family protein [Propionicicella superfundia]
MYTFIQVFVIRSFAWLFFGARLYGHQNIPRTGPVIIAANHLAAGETVILPSLIHRRVAFLAKAELFAGDRGPVSKLVAWFLRSVKMVPLDRTGGRDTLAALRHAIDVLHEGGAVAMFPEGTRSPDGRLYKGKTGVARLALATGAPVVPIGLVNTPARRTRIGIRWYWRPEARAGEPLRFDRYLGRAEDREVVRYVTDEIMAAIQSLTGQEYVDVYASGVKHGRITPAEADARVLPRPGHGRSAPAIVDAPPDPPASAGATGDKSP